MKKLLLALLLSSPVCAADYDFPAIEDACPTPYLISVEGSIKSDVNSDSTIKMGQFLCAMDIYHNMSGEDLKLEVTEDTVVVDYWDAVDTFELASDGYWYLTLSGDVKPTVFDKRDYFASIVKFMYEFEPIVSYVYD